MKLSILIPTITGREKQYNTLMEILKPQLYEGVEVCTLKDNKAVSIGKKRNILLRDAEGEYTAFADDDDKVTPDYVSLLLKGIEGGFDCCSLKGKYYVNGIFDGLFEHSLNYKEWKTNGAHREIKYERYPNHLNCIKASIAKQFQFEEINHGEDHKWAKAIHESGLLKTEYYIEKVIYHYFKVTKNV